MHKRKYTRVARKPRSAIFPIGPSIAYIPLTRGMFASVDWDDAIWLQSYSWFAHKRSGQETFNADTHNPEDHSKILSMHALILGLSGREITSDHVNPSLFLCNMRWNLRPASRSQQSSNRRLHGNNKSGYKGVSYHKLVKKWQAVVYLNRKAHHLGWFTCPKEAYKAYCETAPLIHGKFSRTA